VIARIRIVRGQPRSGLFHNDGVLVDAVKVPEIRNEPLEKSLVGGECMAPFDVVCVYVVMPDLS
jgi:hypothetical protein